MPVQPRLAPKRLILKLSSDESLVLEREMGKTEAIRAHLPSHTYTGFKIGIVFLVL